jgi:hypothetical protein
LLIPKRFKCLRSVVVEEVEALAAPIQLVPEDLNTFTPGAEHDFLAVAFSKVFSAIGPAQNDVSDGFGVR